MATRFLTAVAILLAFAPVLAAAPVTNLTFVAFDIETTGLSSTKDRIVEIAAVKFRGTTVLGTFSTLVAPGIPIPAQSRSIHGITDDMVKNAPPPRKALSDFLEFVEDTVLLAHNAPFDLRFVKAETKRHGLPFGARTTIDTLPLARRWFPGSKRHNLSALAAHLELPAARAHRALADAQRVRLVFLAGIAKESPNIGLDRLMGERARPSFARNPRDQKSDVGGRQRTPGRQVKAED